MKFTMSMSLHKQLHYKELELEGEYLFRPCSVATNLVTPLEFNPIRCATTLCHFGRSRNGSVAARFILLSSTATSTATGHYVAVLERVGQKEEPASRNVERTNQKLIFVPKSVIK